MIDFIIDARNMVEKVNAWALEGRSFLFFADCWGENFVVLGQEEVEKCGILWQLGKAGNVSGWKRPLQDLRFDVSVVDYGRYCEAFYGVQRAQREGNSWLANLTFPSRIETDVSLENLMRCAHAPYRVCVPGYFAFFSPERFVRIDESGEIVSCPMKGTAEICHGGNACGGEEVARRYLLGNEKEMAEHITIVDLIRNDLSMVARRVQVPRFRFFLRAVRQGGDLLQMSSEVSGELGVDWRGRLGSILVRLLPAGSVTGAPKKSSCEILKDVERYERGWYSGVFGFFNGRCFDSCVMIRFAEMADSEGGLLNRVYGADEEINKKINKKVRSLIYKSGGGITIYSDVDREYEELKAKIYVPFD